jgi:hypothetical protein
MTSPSEEFANILSKIDPAEIDVDSLGRIIVRSPELREALRAAASQAPAAEAPTNGSQCSCTNESGCHGHAQ